MITGKHRCVRRCEWVLTSFALILALFVGPRAFAGPPFQTDDPEPVEFRHYEAYLFGTFDCAGGATLSEVPAGEFNWGAAPNLQIHLIVPGTYLSASGAYGIGDAEFGIKYRFVQESSKRPQIGAFPLIELPTRNSRLGLGNGQVWARLPVWIQKSHGPWRLRDAFNAEVLGAGSHNEITCGNLYSTPWHITAFSDSWTPSSLIITSRA
jgi:hypothetical protein